MIPAVKRPFAVCNEADLETIKHEERDRDSDRGIEGSEREMSDLETTRLTASCTSEAVGVLFFSKL